MKFENRTLVLTGLLIFVITLFLRIWRISYAPDIHGDEITYNVISNNLLTNGNLTYRSETWFVHPPLYYIFLACYLFINSQNSVTLDSIYIARTLSGIFAAIMIVVVFLLITKMYDLKSATIVSILLMLDPYLVKYSRIGMLESAALMFIVLTIYLFYNAETSGSFKQYLFAGISLGFTLLTKEMAGYVILSIIIYVVTVRHLLKTKISFQGLSIFFGVATFIYMIYVAWGRSIDINLFFSSKSYLVKRIAGVIIDTGYLRDGYNSLYTDILETFWLYGITHMLILLSIPSGIYLLLKEKKRETIFLVSWLFVSFLFLFVIRIRNPQFYCYVIVPAIMLDGMVLSSIIKKLQITVSKNKFNIGTIVGVIFLLSVIGYNGYIWNMMYGSGTDTAYAQSINYIKLNIPEDSKIFVMATSRFLLPEYQIYFGTHSVSGLETRGINYFVISPRQYYMVNDATLDYVLRNGRLLASFEGHSLRKVDIYYIQWG